MKETTKETGYIVLSKANPALILCTDGEFHARSMTGPGGYSAKVYKTETGAQKSHPLRTIQPIEK